MPVAEAPSIAPPTVSVVICAYTVDRILDLRAALDSIRRQTLAPHEVIVVVDHNLHLLELLRRTEAAATIVASAEPQGLAGARNCGIAVATGELVAFLDDDAQADPSWIESLVRTYAEPTVVGVGGLVEPAFEESRPAWMPSEFDWVVGCSYTGQPDARAPVRNLIGCNMSFRREALDRVDGFAVGLGRVGNDAFGCEETDLCIRIRAAYPGSTIEYEPAARVLHQVPASRTNLSYFLERCRAEGRSKAEVVRRSGSETGLESERTYVRRTLPLGIATGLTAFVRGDRTGLARAGAIIAGLAATAFGYVAGGGLRAVAR